MPPHDPPPATPERLPAPERPLLTLAFEVSFCRFEFRFNDVPLLSADASTSEVCTELPLNPLALTGDNALTVSLRPGERANGTEVALDGPHTRCLAEVTVRPWGAPASMRKRLTGVEFTGGRFAALDPDPDAPAMAVPGALTPLMESAAVAMARRAVALQVPFPQWLWARGERLSLDDRTTADLVAQYREFWSVMQRKDAAALRAVTHENAREVQAAYFLPSTEAGHDMLALEGMLSDPDVSLKPMELDLRLELLAEGRLARLVAPDGRSAIRVVDAGLGAEGAVSLLYCRVPERGWVQIR